MPTYDRQPVILAGVKTQFGGNEYTHDDVSVTVTATMKNGSLLKADGTEATAAQFADVVGILDAPEMELVEVGDELLTRMAARNVSANYNAMTFSDAVYAGEVIMAGMGLKTQKVNVIDPRG